MKQEVVEKILKETRSNYNTISQDWSRTRQNLWAGLADFLPYLKSGDKILDVGCGNGRLIKLFQDFDIDYTGIDNSEELLKIAKKDFSSQKFIFGDILNLPVLDNSVDAVFCIAVLHHIPSKKLRRQAVKELYRVVRPGGLIFMTNWHYSSMKLSNLATKFTLAKISGKSELDFGDIFIDWGVGGTKRYVHLFTKFGIKKMFKSAGFKIIENYSSEYSKRGFRNVVTIAKNKITK